MLTTMDCPVRAFEPNDARKRAVSATSAGVVSSAPISRKESRLSTDEASHYTHAGAHFDEHLTVNHSEEEYVRGDASTNAAKNYFSVFKRGLFGVYQHCGEKHLHRYLAKYDFRYNNRSKLGVEDAERAQRAMAGIEGKRLTYRRSRLRTH
jgi:hypothetical protein